MKRWIAGLAAVGLLLALAACAREEKPVPDTPETPPAVETPAAPEQPEEKPESPEQPEQPEEEPPAEPPAGAAVVTEAVSEGSVEEAVGYRFSMPEVRTENDGVDQILNNYYASAAGKLEDLAWGEAYEQALEEHAAYDLTAEYRVMHNEAQMLSVYRTVTLTNRQTGISQVTAYAETFNLENGGLLTAGDFFDVEESVYSQRLADCVRRQIREDPYHDQNYFAQWEDLVLAAFSKDQFYVTGDGYCVFYQENDLGGAAETVFEIPWSQLEDLLK